MIHPSRPEANPPELEELFTPAPGSSTAPASAPARGTVVSLVVRAVMAAAVVALGFKLLGLALPSGVQTAAVAALALLALDRLARDSRSGAAVGALAACAVLAVKWLAPVFLGNWRDPHTWDFLAFYVDGSVAARGLDFYDPRSYQQVFAGLAIPFTPEAGFVEEIVDAAFKYPPMTMLLFAPLGHLPFATSHAVWLVFVVATTVAAVIAVALLIGHGSLLGRLFGAAALVCAMPAIGKNSFYEQTGALLLALAALVAASNGARRAGLWAGLAACVKPIMAVAIVHLVARRHRTATIVALATLAVALVAAVLAFGAGTSLDYVRSGWMSRVPEWQYTGWTNQSLLGTMLRLDPALPKAALSYPPFLLAAGWIAVFSIVLAARVRAEDSDLAFGLLLCAGLLLYPGTLDSYSTLLLVPLVALHRRRGRFRYGGVAVPIGAAVVYLLLSRVPFAANLLMWLVLATLTFLASRRARRGIAPAPPVEKLSGVA